jgi:hypothetical protein
MELSISFFSFAYGQASFFYSIAPCILSLNDLGEDTWDMTEVFILKGYICG